MTGSSTHRGTTAPICMQATRQERNLPYLHCSGMQWTCMPRKALLAGKCAPVCTAAFSDWPHLRPHRGSGFATALAVGSSGFASGSAQTRLHASKHVYQVS
jgi:hypothetical protein